MKLFRSVLALAVIGGLVLCAVSSDVFAQKGKGTYGKVTELKIEKDKGSITIESKKKDDTEVKKHTFNISDKTKVKNAPKEKGGEATDAKLEDVKVGSLVSIQAEEGKMDATVITILSKKKATN